MPVLLDAGLARVNPEAVQLGSFSQAALELGEAGEGGEPDNVVPQPDRVLVTGQPADDRPEERGPVGRPEVDDRGTDVLAGQRERLVGFGPQFTVPVGVIEGIGQRGGQSGPLEQRLDELAASPFFRSQCGRGCGVERLGADRLVQGPDRLAAVLGAGPGGHPQQPQPGGVASLVACREVTVVVDVGVEHAQRDEPPVHGVVALSGDLPDPFARHPGERAQRIEVEVDIRVVHDVLRWPSG